MSDTAGSGSLSSESLSSGSLSSGALEASGAERTIFNVPVTTVGNGSSSLANVLSPMLKPMANMKHALIDPVVSYKAIPQADVSLKKKPAKKKPTATTKGDGSAIQQQGGVTRNGLGAKLGLPAPPPGGYNWWVDYSKSPQGIREGSDVRQSIIANGKLAKMRGMEQIISPSFLETTLTRLGEMSENMKALTTINENVSSLNENVKALLEASKRANTTEETAEEAETNNSQEGGRRRRRKTKGRRKGRRGTRRR